MRSAVYAVALLVGLSPVRARAGKQTVVVPDSFAVQVLEDAVPLADSGYVLVDSACQVFRLEANGVTPRWGVRIPAWQACVAVAVYPTGDTLAVAGRATDTTIGLALLDPTGQLLWGGSFLFFPSPLAVYPRDLLVLPGGMLMVVGWIMDSIPIAFAYLLTSTGVPAQMRTYHLSDPTLPTRVQQGVYLPVRGEVMLTGSAPPDTSNPAYLWLFTVDPSGNPTGFSVLVGTSWAEERGQGIRRTQDHGILVAGEQQDGTTTRGMVLRLDAQDQLLWSHVSAQPSSSFRDVVEGPSGDLMAVGTVGTDGLVLHLSGNGIPLGAFRYGGSHPDALNRGFSIPQGWQFFGSTASFGVARGSVYGVQTDTAGQTCNAQILSDTVPATSWNLVHLPVSVATRAPDLGLSASLTGLNAMTQVVCSGTAVEESLRRCASPAIRFQVRPSRVVFAHPHGYQVFRADGRRILAGYGQTVHLPSGVYRIRVDNRVISVWVP